MRTLVFCPTHRLEPETVTAIFEIRGEGVDYLFTRDNPHDNSLDRGRANILYNYQKGRRAFLDGSYDQMLVIENDMIPPPDTLEKLTACNADLAYGLYCFRHGDKPSYWQMNAYRYVENKRTYPDQPISLFPKALRQAWGKVIPVSGGALGCVLIKRSVLEAIDFRGGDTWCDHYFTLDAWRGGYDMKCDMSVTCGHIRPDGLILWPTIEGCEVKERA